MATQPERGFSLIEVMFALAVLLVGVLGAAAVMAAGTRVLGSSPGDVIGTQKAAQAIESVFAARDSHLLTWAQIRNVSGAASDGGVFLDGPQPLKLPGPDGLVNTADDRAQAIESTIRPGPDQLLTTVDDERVELTAYTREISIREVPNENGMLRSITVTIVYQFGTENRKQTVVTYISAYS
jgi:prepilin-type N-terminal cleavage/methylation domain-containing protein